MSPSIKAQKDKGQGSEAFQVGEHVDIWGEWPLGERTLPPSHLITKMFLWVL